jgi:hypothetical protein
MIALKITMSSGEAYRIRSFAVDSKEQFVAQILSRNQTLLNWYEVVPGTLIKVAHICSIENLEIDDLPEKEEEVEEILDGAEIILKEDLVNSEISEEKEPLKDEE